MSNNTIILDLRADCNPVDRWECVLADWIWITVPAILLLTGTIGNILNVVILTRKALRQFSTSVYFTVLAVADVLVLWTTLVVVASLHVFHTDIHNLSYIICKFNLWIGYSCSVFSSWIIVIVTFERVIMIRYPFYAKVKFTPTFAMVISGLVMLCCQLLTSHLLYGLEMVPEHDTAQNNTADIKLVCGFVSTEYSDFYNTYFGYILLFGCNLTTVICIIIGNCTIVMYISKQKQKVLPKSTSGQIPRLKRKDIQPTKMLFVLCLFYIITTTPHCVFMAAIRSRTYSSPNEYALVRLLYVICLVLLWSNYTFNFLLYMKSGKLFKIEWTNLVQTVKAWFSKRCYRLN